MSVLDDLADSLALDAIKASEDFKDITLIEEMSKFIGASSPTFEEAFLTQVRIHLAAKRGRKWLEERVERKAAEQAAGE